MSTEQPAFRKTGFNCPNCNAFAHQRWLRVGFGGSITKHFMVAECVRCDKYTLWKDEVMIHPAILTAPMAQQDMPDDVRKIYMEARDVARVSARAAAALLRVALEKLTVHLGEEEGTLNARIKNLNSKGLPEEVIQSLDIVRITANEGGSHAGQIDLEDKDNNEIVDRLFWLVNFVVEKTISDKKKINEMFTGLPEDKKAGISNRDK